MQERLKQMEESLFGRRSGGQGEDARAWETAGSFLGRSPGCEKLVQGGFDKHSHKVLISGLRTIYVGASNVVYESASCVLPATAFIGAF